MIFRTPTVGAAGAVVQTQTNRLTIDSAAFNVQNTALQKDGLPVLHVLAEVTGIDMTAVAATNLYTVPTGKTVQVFGVTLQVTAFTAPNGDSAAGVGINGTEDDIVASQNLTNFGSGGLDDGFSLSPAGGLFRIADAGEIIKLGVDTGDSGTALTATARLYGIEY